MRRDLRRFQVIPNSCVFGPESATFSSIGEDYGINDSVWRTCLIDRGLIARRTWEVPSRLDALLYVCHHRLVTSYLRFRRTNNAGRGRVWRSRQAGGLIGVRRGGTAAPDGLQNRPKCRHQDRTSFWRACRRGYPGRGGPAGHDDGWGGRNGPSPAPSVEPRNRAGFVVVASEGPGGRTAGGRSWTPARARRKIRTRKNRLANPVGTPMKLQRLLVAL